ncbi:AraC family ligand binding domain-containing protein [Agrobacterium tumefaciens]
MMTQLMPEGTKLGKVGDEIILENDFVRVWRLSLAPGDIQAWHQHDLPYLVVPLTKGENVMRFASGKVRPTVEAAGDALWREPGEPHELENTSDWQYSNLLIELKK